MKNDGDNEGDDISIFKVSRGEFLRRSDSNYGKYPTNLAKEVTTIRQRNE